MRVQGHGQVSAAAHLQLSSTPASYPSRTVRYSYKVSCQTFKHMLVHHHLPPISATPAAPYHHYSLSFSLPPLPPPPHDTSCERMPPVSAHGPPFQTDCIWVSVFPDQKISHVLLKKIKPTCCLRRCPQ